ncbi:TPA: glycosyltransferase [Clostridium perfringens]|uniref:glycosyltransferase family 4 protein n=1 Tax=Clostridium perfringens TaxID=1502 RepID=UPI0024BD4097|nr:glycosyltransferase family 4 protein [Clostridium perfringens]EGS5728535.1 glycosyltransferase family 4 protein [Clostridium perfringens]MDM0670375.1 glycosyltransferase family 4 protein [Clostridium perfringens]
MRIIHVEDYFDPMAGYQINELLNVNRNFKDDVFLITSDDMSPFHKKVNKKNDLLFEEKTGVKIIRLKSKLKLSSRIILKGLFEEINKLNPDLVYMHGIGDFKDLSLWRKKKNYKIVRDCHMSWIASKNKFRKIYYAIFSLFFASIINNSNKYERVFALGEEEYEYLKKIGIQENKIDYLYHGYNNNDMYYDYKERKQIREYYNFKDNEIIISYIGKFDFAKRPDLIIDIINKLDKDLLSENKLKLLFIGSKNNKYMEEFNIKLKKLNPRVEYLIDDAKPFNQLRKYYSASDICIFPRETTLSSIHAQVCGCSVIMENHKSNKERVINNNNLYNIGNLDEAANILTDIINKNQYNKENNKNIINSISFREYKSQYKKLHELFAQNN